METTGNKNAATLVHLSTLTQYMFPFGNFIMPIIIWSSLKHKSAFVERHGRNVINFELSLLLYCIVTAIIAIPVLIYSIFNEVSARDFFNGDLDLSYDLSLGGISGLPLIAAVLVVLYVTVKVAEFFLVIYAAVKASNGEDFKYPLTINFIKEQKHEPTNFKSVSCEV